MRPSVCVSLSLPSLVIRRPRYHGNGCRYVENVDEVYRRGCVQNLVGLFFFSPLVVSSLALSHFSSPFVLSVRLRVYLGIISSGNVCVRRCECVRQYERVCVRVVTECTTTCARVCVCVRR